jgi:hypothetical protein
VFLMGLLLREWGLPRAGVAASFLLAVHPWHILYGVDGRAYGFVVLFTILGCLWLTKGLRSGAWRYWLLYGGSQLLLLWTHPMAIFVTLSLGLFGLVGLLRAQRSLRDRLLLAARFSVANLAAAMVLFQVMAPNLSQVAGWTDVQRMAEGRHVDARAVERLWTFLSTGMPRSMSTTDPDAAAFPAISKLAAEHAWVDPLVFWVLPVITLVGLARLALRRGPQRWAALGLGAAVPVTLLAGRLQGFLFYERFAVFGLVAVVAFLAVGLETFLSASRFVSRRLERIAVPVGLGLGLVAFQALVAPQTAILLQRPYSPMHDVADFVSAQAGEDPQSVIRAGLGLGGGAPRVWDPWILPINTGEEIAALCTRALEEKKPLYIFYGYPQLNRRRRADAFEYLDDPRLFTQAARFDGISRPFIYRVLRYTGAPPHPSEGESHSRK